MGITCSNCNLISNETLDFYPKPNNQIQEITTPLDNKEKSVENQENSLTRSKFIEVNVERKVSLENVDYFQFFDHKEEEITVVKPGIKILLPEFVKNQIEIKHFCSTHMIHQSYFNNNFDNLEISSIKPKFLTKKLFETLKTNLTVINDNINNYLQICTSQNGNNVNLIEKRNFLCFESSAENSLTLINFKKKKYFYVTENKHNGLSNKIENFIFVLNTEEDVLNHYTQNDEFIGCQVFENGKLFAGKFNNEGKINGEGIYINKKGNLICGTFQNSDIKRGKVYTKDGIIYEGTLKNLKRHGKGQTEIKKGFYEFIGDFESDKRIKGKFIYDQSNPKFKYIRNAHIDDYHKFREKNKPCLVKLRFKFKDREYFYNGFIENNKLVDENASLVYSKKGYPKFEGCLKQNRKEGKGKYHWSLEEFYSGSFLKNKFHSMSFNGGLKEFFNNPDHLKKDNNEVNLICIGQKTYSVIFDKGELLGFIELKNV